MKWLLKLLGFKSKVIILSTEWGSEFHGKAIAKVSIDSKFDARDLYSRVNRPIFTYFEDYETAAIFYEKDEIGINNMMFFRDYQLEKANNSTLTLFNNHFKKLNSDKEAQVSDTTEA